MGRLDNFQRRAIRAATQIHQHLLLPVSQGRLALPQTRWQELEAGFNRLHTIQRRSWHAASQCLASDLDYQLRRLAAEMDSLRARLPQVIAHGSISQPSAIVGDLLMLPQEFDFVEIDLKAKRICVITGAIELEEIPLGPFQIVLHWERIGAGRAYDVVASDPNCPVGRKDVTHPHVEDDQLCEGAGAPAIRSALNSGRLLDFFVLVRQVLETYNGNSPYVPLSDWSGSEDISCADCGCSISSDEAGRCERCDVRVCGDCECSCAQCSRYTCCECCRLCAQCSQGFCESCLKEAADRQRLICDGCLSQQKVASQDDQEQQSATAAHAVRLGEAAIPP